jgi:hypothetical protein
LWQIPENASEYLVADIDAGEPGRSVSVYLRNRQGRHEIVGVERFWLPRGKPVPAASRARAAVRQ